MRTKLTSWFLILGGLLATAAYGVWLLWQDERYASRGPFGWHGYAAPDEIAQADRLRQVQVVLSAGVPIHLDVYPQPDRAAPVLIWCHGAAGYGRMFVALALRFYRYGYTVLLPDIQGNGYSGGRRGDYTVPSAIRNLEDVAQWAQRQYPGPLFLGGASIGSGLAYATAAAGVPARALACVNLFDFQDRLTARGLCRFPALVAALPVLRLLVPVLGWLRLPLRIFTRLGKLFNEQDARLQAAWQADPVPAQVISLRGLVSLGTTPPVIPLERNLLPILVINPLADRMVSPEITRHNYDRLSGPKAYLGIYHAGHWSGQPEFLERIAQEADRWFQQAG